MSRALRFVAAIALLGVCAYLGALNWRLIGAPGEPAAAIVVPAPSNSANDPSASNDGTTAPGPDLAPPALASLEGTLRRPLFEPSRRKVELVAASAVVEPQPQSTGDLPQLLGIVIDEGRTRALLRGQDGGPAQLVAQGISLDGWLVEEIHPGRVVVSADGQRQELTLYASRP